MKNILTLLSLLCLISTPTLFSAPEKAKIAEPVYTGEALKIKVWLEDLFKASQAVNKPKSDTNPNRSKVLSGLDWEQISKDCLGKDRWNKQAKKRAEFQKLLREIIGYTAWGRLEEFWKNTNYKFKKIEVKGTEAHVQSDFITGADVFSLDYFLSKKSGKWNVYDLSFEGLRYSEDIKEKLDSYLAEKSFDELLSSLKKRLADLKEDKGNIDEGPSAKAHKKSKS